jgi:hypothetical protein
VAHLDEIIAPSYPGLGASVLSLAPFAICAKPESPSQEVFCGLPVLLCISSKPFRATHQLNCRVCPNSSSNGGVFQSPPNACLLGMPNRKRVEYALPMGALGRIPAGRFVRRKLDRLFLYLHEVTARAAGAGGGDD